MLALTKAAVSYSEQMNVGKRSLTCGGDQAEQLTADFERSRMSAYQEYRAARLADSLGHHPHGFARGSTSAELRLVS